MAVKNFSYEDAVISASSVNLDILLKEQWKGFSPKLILFFASSELGGDNPAAIIKNAFPDAEVVGCTSHSEFYKNKFTSRNICAMGFDDASVSDVCVEVVTEPKNRKEMRALLREMHGHFGGYDAILDEYKKFVGIVLFELESVSISEESFMDSLGMVTDVPFVGGTASSNNGRASRVYCNGEEHTDAVVLAILKTTCGFDILKTQSADLLCEQAYTATHSDAAGRMLYELDGRPAIEVYAEAVGVSTDEATNRFTANPFGMLSGRELFIRAPKERLDGAISMFCGLPEGARVYILKSGDIVEDTRNDLEKVITYEPSGVIQFNCYHRTLELLERNQMQPYCNLFGAYNSIGLSTAGEAYLGQINKTAVILAIQ